jgi:hypothetical protein
MEITELVLASFAVDGQEAALLFAKMATTHYIKVRQLVNHTINGI